MAHERVERHPNALTADPLRYGEVVNARTSGAHLRAVCSLERTQIDFGADAHGEASDMLDSGMSSASDADAAVSDC